MSLFNQPQAEPRRLFAVVQAGKGLLGLTLGLGYVLLVGPPDAFEWVAIAGLVAPLLLALTSLTSFKLAALEQAGLALSALLIGYLAALTGGLQSPLMVWLVLVPAEAALAGGRRAVARAGVAAGLVVVGLATIQMLGQLPPSRLPLPASAAIAIAILVALVQAGLIATAAQDRQRAADRAARKGAAMYQLLAENAGDLITRHAPDGRILFASPAALSLLGRPPSELEGKMPDLLTHPGDLCAVQEAFRDSALRGREGAAQARLSRGGQDGQDYVWAEIRCRPAARLPSGMAEIVAVTRDISERKMQEQALIEARDAAMSASRAKTAFLANMSHELRTPLNAIIGFSELMAREIFGPLGHANYQDYARLIHDSGGHLLELINEVLDMSKIEAGKFELYRELFAFEDVVAPSLRFVKLAANRAGVTLTTAIDPSAVAIFADKRAVKQILVNLLSNGIKFTPRGGQVGLEAASGEKGVEILVRDSGIGIANADLEKLGRPFEQAESSPARAKEGTGLGLALVKSLAAMHGGELLLESVQGVGTTAKVRLPFARVDDKVARPGTGQATGALRGAA
ncbi:MAG: PAS domain-containing sensor histidine kinase [Rhizomicrobium sp.]